MNSLIRSLLFSTPLLCLVAAVAQTLDSRDTLLIAQPACVTAPAGISVLALSMSLLRPSWRELRRTTRSRNRGRAAGAHQKAVACQCVREERGGASFARGRAKSSIRNARSCWSTQPSTEAGHDGQGPAQSSHFAEPGAQFLIVFVARKQDGEPTGGTVATSVSISVPR
ncbi:hypothetical protein KRP22_007728 [Phytophthora ramorum]